MKNLFKILILLFVISACEKQDKPEVTNFSLSFKLDGKTYNTNYSTAFLTVSDLGTLGKLHSLIFGGGIEEREVTISIYSEDAITEKSYDLKQNNNYAVSLLLLNHTTTDFYFDSHCNTESGQIRITGFDEINQTISGTFFGKVCLETGESVNITEGTFTKIKYSLTE